MALCKFKYVASEIVEYLLRQTIRFTQPDALNDPFEMKRFREKHIEQTTSELWAAPAAATSIIMDQLTKHPTEIPLVSSTDALKELLQSSLNFIKNIPGNSLAAEWMKLFLPASGQTFTAPYSAQEILDKRKQAQEWIGKMDQYAILSLTQYANNLLMWAHYAEEHRGAVLEIDVEDETFCMGFTKGHYADEKADEWRSDVHYPEKRAIPPASHEEFIATLFLKSPQWNYEAEYRIIRLIEKGTKTPLIDRTGHDIYLFPLPARCIKQLIFGARSENTFRNHIAGIISGSPELAHIVLSQAQLRQDIYGLEITPFAVP